LLQQVPFFRVFLDREPPVASAEWVIAVFGTGVLMIILLASGAVHIGLAGRGCTDFVREWRARLAGYLMLVTFSWLLLASTCIFGPLLVRYAFHNIPKISISAVRCGFLPTGLA
jgi:hypothetical protein